MVLPLPITWVGCPESVFPEAVSASFSYKSPDPATGPQTLRKSQLPLSSTGHLLPAPHSTHAVTIKQAKEERGPGCYTLKRCQPMQNKVISHKKNWHLSRIDLPYDTNSGTWQDGSSFHLFFNYPNYVSLLDKLSLSPVFSMNGCDRPRPFGMSGKAPCQSTNKGEETLKSCLATPLTSSQSPFPSSSPARSVSSQTVIQTADSSGRELLPEILAGNVHLWALVSSLCYICTAPCGLQSCSDSLQHAAGTSMALSWVQHQLHTLVFFLLFLPVMKYNKVTWKTRKKNILCTHWRIM